tara:strand:+ start:1073 stop:1249 length:177 start_codon:yes stop_codon:yes gene_type:complete
METSVLGIDLILQNNTSNEQVNKCKKQEIGLEECLEKPNIKCDDLYKKYIKCLVSKDE